MGYRRLIAKYMQHVNTRSRNIWLGDLPHGELSRGDMQELRSIWLTIEREVEIDTEGDFNARTVELCNQHRLSGNDVAQQVGWPKKVVEEWLLTPEHPKHRIMTRRDFEHFYLSILTIIQANSEDQ